MVAFYERVVVDAPPDVNINGPVRARSPGLVLELRRLHAGGASPRDLARVYQVSVRTVYRYLDTNESFETVHVGPWTATFAVASNLPPKRVSAWRRG